MIQPRNKNIQIHYYFRLSVADTSQIFDLYMQCCVTYIIPIKMTNSFSNRSSTDSSTLDYSIGNYNVQQKYNYCQLDVIRNRILRLSFPSNLHGPTTSIVEYGVRHDDVCSGLAVSYSVTATEQVHSTVIRSTSTRLLRTHHTVIDMYSIIQRIIPIWRFALKFLFTHTNVAFSGVWKHSYSSRE